MSAAHVWRCGRCGGRVTAQVGAILAAFRTHAEQCPAQARRRPPTTPPRRPRPARGAAAAESPLTSPKETP
jgi:hypothetical protein